MAAGHTKCKGCNQETIRYGYGFDMSDPKSNHWVADLELVECPTCGGKWLEVVKECRQWQRASRQAGRHLPYCFGSA